jgi:hypothetical protein
MSAPTIPSRINYLISSTTNRKMVSFTPLFKESTNSESKSKSPLAREKYSFQTIKLPHFDEKIAGVTSE